MSGALVLESKSGTWRPPSGVSAPLRGPHPFHMSRRAVTQCSRPCLEGPGPAFTGRHVGPVIPTSCPLECQYGQMAEGARLQLCFPNLVPTSSFFAISPRTSRFQRPHSSTVAASSPSPRRPPCLHDPPTLLTKQLQLPIRHALGSRHSTPVATQEKTCSECPCVAARPCVIRPSPLLTSPQASASSPLAAPHFAACHAEHLASQHGALLCQLLGSFSPMLELFLSSHFSLTFSKRLLRGLGGTVAAPPPSLPRPLCVLFSS